MENWSDSLKENADHVCQVYGTVGMLARARLIPREAFFENSGVTVVRAYDTAHAWVLHRAKEFYEKPWPNFEWLAEQARSRKSFDNARHQQWLARRGGDEADREAESAS